MAFPTHPLYDDNLQRWQMLKDAFDGEEIVKAKGTQYLPATPGQILDGMKQGCARDNPGYVSYKNYLRRARFPDFFTEGVKTLVGILNEKPPKIKVPKEMEYIFEHVTKDGDDVLTLLRSIHFTQLKFGRGGLLVELPANSTVTPEPYIALYDALQIVNWDDGQFNEGQNVLNMVVLDESGFKRTSAFSWQDQESFRILSLGSLRPDSPLEGSKYRQMVVESDTQIVDTEEVVPLSRDEPLDKIPFTFFGPVDLDATPDQPPLIGLANLCMHIYSSEADYRYALFMQGQDTLVVVGGVRNTQQTPDSNDSGAVRVGADSRIDVNISGDAKYIGVSSKGLPEMRTAIENDKQLAAVRTGQLLAPGKMSMESGEALKTRVAAQTATLTSVAVASATALKSALQDVARWKGLNPDDVSVEPNLDFSNYRINTQDLVQAQTAKRLGYPLSFKTLHQIARDRGITNKTFDEEMEEIRNDPKELTAIMQTPMKDTGNNPIASSGGPEAKPPEDKSKKGNSQTE